MEIRIIAGQMLPGDQRLFEVVERKGIGHPDTLADLVAEMFSNKYSQLSLQRFGGIANHWVDKVNLVGATSRVAFGSFEVTKPINAYLFGKVTGMVGGDEIEIMALFRESVEQVFREALMCPEISSNITFSVDNTASVGVDHPADFYQPLSSSRLKVLLNKERKANDTVFCSAYMGLSILEHLCIAVENYINGREFKASFPMTGTDVKVMGRRYDRELDFTVCVPFHPELTPSEKFYYETIERCRSSISQYVSDALSELCKDQHYGLRIHINTKDEGRQVYLAPFGTALGKGDCGAVGRGNRYNGIISAFRVSNIEAPAGKNPVHHAGKLYNALALQASETIWKTLNLDNEIVIVAQNGDSLVSPAAVIVSVPNEPEPEVKGKIASLIDDQVHKLAECTDNLINDDPVARFRCIPKLVG